MKYLLPLIFVIAGFIPVQAQAQPMSKEWKQTKTEQVRLQTREQEKQIANEWVTRKVNQVHPGLYKVEYSKTPYTSMKGYLSHHRGHFVREGVWTVYRHGHPVQRIRYSNGNRLWIELENGRRYTQQEIQIQQLRLKVIELEKQLADVKDL